MNIAALKSMLAAMTLFSISACSDAPKQTARQAEPVRATNAEFVLDEMEISGATGVAFHVKPVRNAACEHMYVEISLKDENGKWDVTHALYPGKEARENFGQTPLADQIQFSTINAPGPYAVTALGCKPYGQDMWVFRGVLATFRTEAGKLNYAGEIGYDKKDKTFVSVTVADRSDFAKDLVTERMPAFAPYWQSNVMEEFTVKLPPEQLAALKKLAEKQKADQVRLEYRNTVANKFNTALRDMRTWRAVYVDVDEPGVPQEAKAEYKMLQKSMSEYRKQIEDIDGLIAQNKSIAFIQAHMRLIDNLDAANARYRAYAKIHGYGMDRDGPMEPERIKLLDDTGNARQALREHKG